MRSTPNINKKDKEKQWALGTVFQKDDLRFHYVEAGEELGKYTIVKLGENWVVSPANSKEEVFSATEVSVKKGEKFWLRIPDRIKPFKVKVA